MAEKISLVARWPFLAVATIIGAATVCAAAIRLTEQVPINPWEPAIAMEAMRLNAGLPVYESAHATHMYGPLLTVMLAGIFRACGLNLLAARIVFSIFAFGMAAFLATILCRGKSRNYWLLAFLLFLGINFRTNLVFLSAQPDCLAALFSVGGLYLWVTREKSVWRWAVSLALFIGAMLFKQTSAAFALIPFVHALLWQRKPSDLAISLVPAMSISAALAAIYFLSPQMFFAVVTVPASIKVYPERALGMVNYLFATFPIFIIGVAAIYHSRDSIGKRVRWILSSMLVLIPVSIWTICKSGGSYNSLLIAYLAMTALVVAHLSVISDWLASLAIYRSLLAGSAIVLVMLASFFNQFDRAIALLDARCGDDKYEEAVAVARHLGGGVTSPQDPTIALKADHYFGRSLFFELDSHAVNGNWPEELPATMQEELARSKYVIEVKSYVPTPMLERTLTEQFHRVAIPELAGSAYTVWAKSNG